MVDDLQEVVEGIQEEVAAISGDNLPRPQNLNMLSMSYHLRFDRFGALEDIKKAIRANA